MKRLGFLLLMLFLGGCATIERPKPLTSDELIVLSKSGMGANQVIEELKRTDTVIALSASEIVRLHEAGVPDAVLDYLQRAQIEEIRWRDRYSQMYWYGLGYRSFYNCSWPTLNPRYRGWGWPC